MCNLDKLHLWETHPSRVLYAFEDTDAQNPREPFTTYVDPQIIKSDGFYIETCAYGQQFAVASEAWREHGAAMLRVGMSSLNEAGTYVGHDGHHSVSFFIEAIARAILLADATAFTLTDTERVMLQRCGEWFADPVSWQDRWWRDTMHHRFFLNAAGVYLLDRAVGLPPWCEERAGAWAAEGVRRQRSDGAHTELGGHDTGYHSLALTFTAGIILTCNLPDAFAATLRDSLAGGAAWLMSRVNSDGDINAEGNTRMSPTKERDRFGVPKSYKPYESAFALAGAGITLDDSIMISAADRIMHRYYG